ncbi:hypothetical protein VV01_21180 [Luteipulveratus halotolerans]|uniref:Uncharacterized protein n=1 Tax=Luteipulveratus halotolerans TaxID=1631356 RepID=A0A0L6CMV5_9MICO|nr:hypothetical protein VV01_21180 [Luteipulveratus halotolerans]
MRSRSAVQLIGAGVAMTTLVQVTPIADGAAQFTVIPAVWGSSGLIAAALRRRGNGGPMADAEG